MSSPKAPTCVGCGAPVPAVLAPTPYVCTFCHRSQILQPPAPPPPPAPPAPPAPPGGRPWSHPVGGPVHVARPLPAPTPGAQRLAVLIPLIAVLAIGGAVVAAIRGGGSPSRSGSGPGSGGVVPSGERLQWASSSDNSVVVTDVNGDGVEDFVGRYRVLDLKGQTSQTEFAGAFDGKTFQRIWASSSMGTLAQAGNSVHAGVANGRVIVTDFRAQAHILDLKTGKETRVFGLSDKARSVCSPGDRRSEVWIELADDKHIVFNLETGAATLSPERPAWCSPPGGASCTGHVFHGSPCAATSEERTALYAAGLSPQAILRTEGRAITLAKKTPGTPIAILAAFDPRTRAIAWQQPVAPDPALAGHISSTPATLANGRVYTTYKTTTNPAELRVTAFDAATGKRVLDFKVPRGESGSEAEEIIVSAHRIYVPHWTWLDVFDARDGRHIETVGMW